jgi:hypothetical protein
VVKAVEAFKALTIPYRALPNPFGKTLDTPQSTDALLFR